MKLESVTAALNLRKGPSTGAEVIGELRAAAGWSNTSIRSRPWVRPAAD